MCEAVGVCRCAEQVNYRNYKINVWATSKQAFTDRRLITYVINVEALFYSIVLILCMIVFIYRVLETGRKQTFGGGGGGGCFGRGRAGGGGLAGGV